MKYDFDKIIDRRGTYACKTDTLPAGCPDDALSAWVADMDFLCAQPVIDAIHRRADHGIFGYTLYENEDCKKAVSGWYQRRFGWEISHGDLFFSPGVVPAIGFLVQALTEPGDGIIIQKPVYYPFMKKIDANGRRIVNNALVRRQRDCEDPQMFDYVMDYADLEMKMADPSNKGMILCSPHNPVGRVWTREELQQVLELAVRYDKWIIADEIHCDLTRNGVTHTPLLKLAAELAPDFRDRIIACTAPSKTFNLAGLSFSSIVIPGAEFKKKWNRVVDEQFGLGFGCNPLSLAGVCAAFNEGEEWLDQLRDYLDGNMAYIRAFIKQHLPKVSMADCQGTYLVWLDFREYCSDGEGGYNVDKLEKAMQDIARVALDEGYIFGREGAGYERINVAMPRSMVEECMLRMKKAAEWLEEAHE